MKHFLTLLFLAVVLLLPGFVSASSDSKQSKRVLVLYSLEKGNAGQDMIDAQLREIFGRKENFDIHIYNEYLDFNRFYTQKNISAVIELLRSKYSREKPDVVIAVLPSALDFVEHEARQLFQGVPVLAAVISRDRAESLARSPFRKRATATVFADNAYEIARSALMLRPKTKHIAFIAGISPIDISFKEPILREIQRAAGGIELIDLSGLSMGETLSRVRTLPPETIVFYTSIFRDKDGVTFNAPDALRLVSHASNAPVFGFIGTHMGKGIVGGRLGSLNWQIDKTAEYTQRILAGESPASIPIVTEEWYQSVYDYKELLRWKIPESILPKGSLLINKDLTVFERYRPYIIASLLFIVFQTFLIGYLSHLNRRQKQTSLQLIEYQERYRELLRIDRSSRLGELTASLAHELNQPLAAILSTAQAALRFLESGKNDPALHREILQNIVQDDKRAGDIIRSLRSMVKKGTVQKERINIFEVLSEVVAIAQGELIAHNIQIETRLDDLQPWVIADKNQIQQVVLNLILNGIDAIDQTASQRRMIIMKAEKSDGFIRVSLRDTGSAIPEENLEKIFDPFFTTKRNGLGMGLAVCKTIVTEHGGRIWAENSLDGGATFAFELEAVDND